MDVKIPRLLIAGLSGDSGKTLSTLCLVAALRRRGMSLSAFKKGPDYIDSAWLSHISGTICRNLDTYLIEPQKIIETFVSHSTGSQLAIIEGNRGIFDGKDIKGSHSTAELAKLLKSPVILIIDSTMATRTIAALIKGCQDFDSEVAIKGVILNRIGGGRHETIIRNSIEEYCRLPVLGAITKLDRKRALIPNRHLGLIPPVEFNLENDALDAMAQVAEEYLEIDGLLNIANKCPGLVAADEKAPAKSSPIVKIGYFRDSAFTFYYPENLEALQAAGAELVEVSSQCDKALPEIDGLYIGGGFPETNGRALANNLSMLGSVKGAAESGMPIYAECGGLIYLCRSVIFDDNKYSMAGVFPIDLQMHTKPIGHGYISVQVDAPNPFFAQGVIIRGHEFHYSGSSLDDPSISKCLRMIEGYGFNGERDGLVYKNTFATYIHIHASGNAEWAPSFVRQAFSFRKSRLNKKVGRSARLCGSK
jgi:cobyrinic acid a,c-diamide synthase